MIQEAIQPGPYRTLQLPPWEARPATAEPFTPSAYVALPAVGSIAVIATLYVGQNRSGVITELGTDFVGGNWTPGNGTIVWQLLRNAVPYRNFNNILTTLGSVAQPRDFTRNCIRMRENDVWQLIIQNINNTAVGQLCGGLLAGYFYPKSLDPKGFW